jgi:hypothetical protein
MSQVAGGGDNDIPLGSVCARQVADPEQSTTSRRVRASARSGQLSPTGPTVPTDQKSPFGKQEQEQNWAKSETNYKLALDESRYLRLTRRVRLDPGIAPPEGGSNKRDYWSDQRFNMKVHGMGVGAREAESSRLVAVAPNLDHIAHTKPDTRSMEGNNVFGCENGTPYTDKRVPMIWPMKGG